MTKSEFLEKYDLVDLNSDDSFVKNIVYLTNNNFMHQVIYEKNVCFLRRKTYEKLVKANTIFNKHGYKIMIYDAFRPVKYQEIMWNYYPDERFVTDPSKGNSIHCKASAVDITLTDLKGNPIKMPTEFDHFGKESYVCNLKNYDKKTYDNVKFLQSVMTSCGFKIFPTEWWHFNDADKYDYILEMYDK